MTTSRLRPQDVSGRAARARALRPEIDGALAAATAAAGRAAATTRGPAGEALRRSGVEVATAARELSEALGRLAWAWEAAAAGLVDQDRRMVRR